MDAIVMFFCRQLPGSTTLIVLRCSFDSMYCCSFSGWVGGSGAQRQNSNAPRCRGLKESEKRRTYAIESADRGQEDIDDLPACSVWHSRPKLI